MICSGLTEITKPAKITKFDSKNLTNTANKRLVFEETRRNRKKIFVGSYSQNDENKIQGFNKSPSWKLRQPRKVYTKIAASLEHVRKTLDYTAKVTPYVRVVSFYSG